MEAEYVFSTDSGHGPQQVNCLADMLDGTTTEVLDSLGEQPGWRCLELGAGNGSIARWLAQRVGSTGTVAAVDLDTSYLDPGPNVTVYRSDINNGLPVNGPFDLIHARLPLMRLSRRQKILGALVDALAPGGWLVIGNLSDRLPVAASAPDPADEKLFERMIDIGMNRVARPAGTPRRRRNGVWQPHRGRAFRMPGSRPGRSIRQWMAWLAYPGRTWPLFGARTATWSRRYPTAEYPTHYVAHQPTETCETSAHRPSIRRNMAIVTGSTDGRGLPISCHPPPRWPTGERTLR